MENKWKFDFLKMIIVVWLITNGCLQAQDTSLVFVDSLHIDAEYVTTDNLQNIYALTANNQLTKYNEKGKRLFTYNNEIYGMPSSIDVSNPLRPFLYFKDFSKGIVLDRTLTELYEYDLSIFDVNSLISVAAPSPDNGIWLFEETQFKLKNSTNRVLYFTNPTI